VVQLGLQGVKMNLGACSTEKGGSSVSQLGSAAMLWRAGRSEQTSWTACRINQ